MNYKPIEYIDFGYGGKTKKVELKIKGINDTSIPDVKGFCANPYRTYGLVPYFDWKSNENNYGNSNKR